MGFKETFKGVAKSAGTYALLTVVVESARKGVDAAADQIGKAWKRRNKKTTDKAVAKKIR